MDTDNLHADEPQFVQSVVAYLAQKGLAVVLAAEAPPSVPETDVEASDGLPNPLKTFPVKFRAWRRSGGYRSFQSFEEARAFRDEDGEAPIRIDRLTHDVLWWNRRGTGLAWPEVAGAIGSAERPV